MPYYHTYFRKNKKKKKERTFRRKITERGNKVIFWSGHVWSSSGRMNARVRTAPGAKSPLLREGIEPRNRRGRRIAQRMPGKETREKGKKVERKLLVVPSYVNGTGQLTSKPPTSVESLEHSHTVRQLTATHFPFPYHDADDLM